MNTSFKVECKSLLGIPVITARISDTNTTLSVKDNINRIKDSFPLYCMIDTGSNQTCVSSDVAKTLSIIKQGHVKTIDSASTKSSSPIYLVDILLPNDVLIQNVEVSALNTKADAIIGMDILHMGDLCLLNREGKMILLWDLLSLEENHQEA